MILSCVAGYWTVWPTQLPPLVLQCYPVATGLALLYRHCLVLFHRAFGSREAACMAARKLLLIPPLPPHNLQSRFLFIAAIQRLLGKVMNIPKVSFFYVDIFSLHDSGQGLNVFHTIFRSFWNYLTPMTTFPKKHFQKSIKKSSKFK